MISDYFIEELKEVVKDIEELKARECYMLEEIHMWRERFLFIQPKIENVEMAAKEWCSFLSLPSFELIEKTPEKIFKNLRKDISNENP